MQIFKFTLIHVASGAGKDFVSCMVLLFYTSILYATESTLDVEVTERGGVYHIKAAVVLNAPADYVRLVLSDFVHIYRLNPSIVESETIATEDDGTTHVRTRVLGCAGYFCQELDRVEKVQILPSGNLIAEVVPEKSEFLSGRTVWHIEDMDERSQVVYESVMEPDFYIPPVVGKFMAKKSIRTEVSTSFKNLERIANVLAERDWKFDYMLSKTPVLTHSPCYLATW